MIVSELAGINADGWAMAEKTKKGFVFITKFNDCEGKDGSMAEAEYSMAGAQETDAQCSQESVETTTRVMIAYKPNKEREIINLVLLSTARFPDGGEKLV